MTRRPFSNFRGPSLLGAGLIVASLLASALPAHDLVITFAVGLALVIALVTGPAVAVTAVAAMLPLVFITAGVGATDWSLLELALICCAVTCVGEVILRTTRANPAYVLVRLLRPLDLTVVAIAVGVVGIVSLEFIADARGAASSQRELRRVILEPLIVIVAVRLSPPETTRRMVTTGLAIGAVVVSILALGQLAVRSSGVEVGSVFRPIGTYPHPNNLALYLERVVWLPAALLLGRTSERIAWGATGIVAVACAATLSRGAVMALAVGGATWLVLSRRRVGAKAAAVSLAAAAGLVVLARVGGDGTESLDSRTKIWQAAAEMIRDYPITGIGLDQFYQLYGTRYVDPSGWSERYTSHPHNIVLDFWLQLGILGVGLLGAILVLVAGRARVATRGGVDPLVAALIAGIIGGIAHGLIDNGFFLPDLATFLWLALALLDRPDSTVVTE